MRVGFVIDDLDPHRGGMSHWSWQFVTVVAQRGYDLHVISQGFGAAPPPPQVTCHAIPRPKTRQAFADAAAHIIQRIEPDVVHDTGLGQQFDIFQPHGGSYAAWIRRRLDIYPKWVRAFKRPMDALLPRRRDFDLHSKRQYAAEQRSGKTFVALSQMVADDFVRLNHIRPEQIRIIHNGVDCRRFSPDHRVQYRQLIRSQLGIDEETLVLFLAAHNFRLKGVPELLRVASRLVANRRSIHVLIAGGKRLAKWKYAANRLGLAGRFTYMGIVADMVPYFAAADAYVHPTYYDPCSLVLLEAAASGLPIITTRRCNGAAELFREGECILTVSDPTDGEALYERVDAIFDHRLRAGLGNAARKVALANPFDKNVAEILKLYDGRAMRRVAA